MYKVFWKGYPKEQYTWEKQENISNLYPRYFKKADKKFKK